MKVSMLLLRHGQSEWNAERRWQGLADSPLTSLGRSQASACASVLGETDSRFGAVWSSPLRRAADTGEIIADRLGLGAVETDERLREADAGEWQGMTPAEIDAAYPGYLADHLRPPTFEPFDDVVERALAVLGAIATTRDPDAGAVLVTTHSGVIRTIVRRLGEADERVANLSGIWIGVSPDERSVTDPSVGFDLAGRFDPGGIVRTGVDAPGEDPGEQPDQADAHSGAQR